MWVLLAIGVVLLVGTMGQMLCNKYIEIDELTDVIDDYKEALEIKDNQITDLRAELLSSHGENQELLGKVKTLEDYNKRLLGNQIEEHNKCCRVNPGNPNIVKVNKTPEPELPI